jgi:ABC-type histidine transport system ATPase subunit
LILNPTTGKIVFDGQTLFQQNGWSGGVDIRRLRREKMGFIFQAHTLIRFLRPRQNVLFPLSLVGTKGESADNLIMELLEYVEMADRTNYLHALLSGGEQWRVAMPGPWPITPGLSCLTNPLLPEHCAQQKHYGIIRENRQGKSVGRDRGPSRFTDDRGGRLGLPSQGRPYEPSG